ncbi:MAG: hypothetical protein Q4Q58_06925 [Thermoplasmata archaeon]|nr:hypothetical protein [Thermoplasmata archaeon]
MRYLARRIDTRIPISMIVLPLAALIAHALSLVTDHREVDIAASCLTFFTLAYILIVGVVYFETVHRAATLDRGEMEDRTLHVGTAMDHIVLEDDEERRGLLTFINKKGIATLA